VQTHAIDGYRPQTPFLDELFAADGTPRPTARALVEVLKRLGPEGLVEAGRRRDAIFMQQGITFETSGGSGAGVGGTMERPFPLDLVPRVLSTTGFDYWESGQDYLPSPDVYNNFVEHQTRLLAEFRRLATEHAFTTVDARGPIADVFRALCQVIEPVVQDMATFDSNRLQALSMTSL